MIKSDNSKVSIRRMKNEEKDMRTLLNWLSNPLVLQWVYGEDAPWDLDKVTEIFAEETGEGGSATACLIMLDGKEIGYIQYYLIKEDSYKFNDQDTYNAVEGGFGIDMFIGEPELWRRGIGKEAVKLLENYLHNEFQVKILCVDPERDNKRAVQFWKKVGFTPISYIKNYDDDSKESILMAKML